MNLLNLVETDDYNKQPFPQMIKNNQNMQTIVLYEFSKFFLVKFPNFLIFFLFFDFLARAEL